MCQDSLIQDSPWVSIGDYNAVVSNEETTSVGNRKCQRFMDWIFQEGLIDLGFSGPNFTWMRGQEESTFRRAHLDHALANVAWREIFIEASVTHLPKLQSDHLPLLLHLSSGNSETKNHSFKFQAAWTRHCSFKDLIRQNWDSTCDLGANLTATASALGLLNRDNFGNIFQKKGRLLARL